MMRYEAQVIAILPVPDAPSRCWDETLPVQARNDTRSLGYEVRAPSGQNTDP
mgnify:CR=1 FL=1